MSNDRQPMTVRVLDREFTINCEPHEREQLLDAARYLDLRMRDARDHGPSLTYEKIAVMSALNICNILLQQERELREREQHIDHRVAALTDKLSRELDDRG
jgi:cell division protein ZapA